MAVLEVPPDRDPHGAALLLLPPLVVVARRGGVRRNIGDFGRFEAGGGENGEGENRLRINRLHFGGLGKDFGGKYAIICEGK